MPIVPSSIKSTSNNPPARKTSAKSNPSYRPELDALRFFAFLCVFAFHRMDYVRPGLAHLSPHPLFLSAHPGLRNAIGATLVLVFTIAIAHLSYRYFESPFLRLKQRFTFVTSRKDG